MGEEEKTEHEDNTPIISRRNFLKAAVYLGLSLAIPPEFDYNDIKMLRVAIQAIEGYGGRFFRNRSIRKFAESNDLQEKGMSRIHFGSRPYNQLVQYGILIPVKERKNESGILYELDADKLAVYKDMIAKKLVEIGK